MVRIPIFCLSVGSGFSPTWDRVRNTGTQTPKRSKAKVWNNKKKSSKKAKYSLTQKICFLPVWTQRNDDSTVIWEPVTGIELLPRQQPVFWTFDSLDSDTVLVDKKHGFLDLYLEYIPHRAIQLVAFVATLLKGKLSVAGIY